MDLATRHRRRRHRPHRLLRNPADTVCRSITFHTDPEHAQSHLDNHPELQGFIVGQADAIALADCAFGPLLAS